MKSWKKYQITIAATSRAATTTIMARRNSNSSALLRRRAPSCRSKKPMRLRAGDVGDRGVGDEVVQVCGRRGTDSQVAHRELGRIDAHPERHRDALRRLHAEAH